MPHFGPKVLGQEAYDALVAVESRTVQHHFGSRVLGDKRAPAGAPPLSTEGTAQEAIAAIKRGEPLEPLIEAELARPSARPTVVKALMSAGAKANLDAELLDQLAASLNTV